FEYYDPLTSGDSSLSAVVQSIMAAQVGHQKAAMDYFRAGLFVDLGNLHGNTPDGVHIASAGGVWNALVHGFGGMRQDEGEISFDPRLPDAWPGLVFPLTVRGSRFRVPLLREEISLTLETRDQLEVSARGQRFTDTPEASPCPASSRARSSTTPRVPPLSASVTSARTARSSPPSCRRTPTTPGSSPSTPTPTTSSRPAEPTVRRQTGQV